MERQEVAILVASLVQQNNEVLLNQLLELVAPIQTCAQAVRASSSSTSPGQLSGPDIDRVTQTTNQQVQGRRESRRVTWVFGPDLTETDWMEDEGCEESSVKRDVPTFVGCHRA